MTKTFWLVYDNCDCEDPGCYGKTDFALFESEQTAKQEADLRSKRWGGNTNFPSLHMQKIEVRTKISGY